MSSLERRIHLILFFTKGISLQAWDKIGMFDREVALYERLRDCAVEVSFLTYGGPSELDYQSRIPGIQILCNQWGIPNWIYERFLHRFHGNVLKSCDLIKTNQTNGAEVALRCARYWEKPLIGRMGYLWSDFVAQENGASIGAVLGAQKIEDELFSSSDRIVLTTVEMANSIRERNPQVSGKTVVIPNYVETDRFAPDPDKLKEIDILFVGRLSPQKNVLSLLNALQKVKAKAMIIGSGELKSELQSNFDNSNNKIVWQGNVSNSALPDFMNSSSLFILPSHYEGHPKTLIEAMACGLTVIGSDSPGIRELIDHGENGYLCGTDSESIGKAIEELLSNPGLCEKMGRKARQYAIKNFSLDRIVEIEMNLYQEIIEKI